MSARTTRAIARSDSNLTNRFIRSGRVLRVSSQRGISRHRHFFVLCLRYSQEASTQHRQRRTEVSSIICGDSGSLSLLRPRCLCASLELTIHRIVPVVICGNRCAIDQHILHRSSTEHSAAWVKGTSTDNQSRHLDSKYMIPAGSIQVARRFAWVTSTISVCSQRPRTTD